MKLYGHYQGSKLNMSEHFLGSSKAFEILANLGLDPLLEDHLAKLKEVVKRMRDAGLKITAAKLCLCTYKPYI
jgi:hypothetical protein